MSEENVEVVRRLYQEVLAEGRIFDPATGALLEEYFDPDIHLSQMSQIVGTVGDFHGYRGLTGSAVEMYEALADLGFVAEELRASGDKVAVVASARGVGRVSGAVVEWRGSHLWTLREGRVVRWEVFDDPSGAFRAGGVSE